MAMARIIPSKSGVMPGGGLWTIRTGECPENLEARDDDEHIRGHGRRTLGSVGFKLGSERP